MCKTNSPETKRPVYIFETAEVSHTVRNYPCSFGLAYPRDRAETRSQSTGFAE
jgi:hypothetical protein